MAKTTLGFSLFPVEICNKFMLQRIKKVISQILLMIQSVCDCDNSLHCLFGLFSAKSYLSAFVSITFQLCYR